MPTPQAELSELRPYESNTGAERVDSIVNIVAHREHKSPETMSHYLEMQGMKGPEAKKMVERAGKRLAHVEALAKVNPDRYAVIAVLGDEVEQAKRAKEPLHPHEKQQAQAELSEVAASVKQRFSTTPQLKHIMNGVTHVRAWTTESQAEAQTRLRDSTNAKAAWDREVMAGSGVSVVHIVERQRNPEFTSDVMIRTMANMFSNPDLKPILDQVPEAQRDESFWIGLYDVATRYARAERNAQTWAKDADKLIACELLVRACNSRSPGLGTVAENVAKYAQAINAAQTLEQQAQWVQQANILKTILQRHNVPGIEITPGGVFVSTPENAQVPKSKLRTDDMDSARIRLMQRFLGKS